jgi:DNA repair photolyase
MTERERPGPKGRGAASRPDPRYLETTRSAEDDGWGIQDELPAPLRTSVTAERVRSVINRNRSPDLPFTASINPYRGCEHGCIYCYARPAHAYVDLSPGLDFESRLFSKPDAPEVLVAELARKGYRCEPIMLGANTDAYQPVERRLRITRELLEVLAACHHPVTIISKSALVERDLDLLAPMAAKGLAQVFISITTLDRELARRLEPRAAAPERRLETLGRVAAAGVPAGVMFAPVIPALNDQELETVLTAAAEVGCERAGYVLLRLPREVSGLFKEWLERHYPLKAARVMSRIRQMRGGADSDARFGRRLVGEGVFAALLKRRFERSCRALRLNSVRRELVTDLFVPPQERSTQLEMFAE